MNVKYRSVSLNTNYYFQSQINPFKCHVAAHNPSNMPHARTWIRTIATNKTAAQIRNNITTFTSRATQYVSGSGSNLNVADFDITAYHKSSKKNLHERTKKGKVGSRVSLVGELDHNNKLYI